MGLSHEIQQGEAKASSIQKIVTVGLVATFHTTYVLVFGQFTDNTVKIKGRLRIQNTILHPTSAHMHSSMVSKLILHFE